MRIRPATVDDAMALAEILVEGWRWAYQGIISDEELAALDVGARMRGLQSRFDPAILSLVAVDDEDHPLGFAIESWPTNLPDFDSEIGGLYVHPNSTRGGIGKALVAAVVERFIGRGARSMAIHTLQKNRIGRAFYERLGGVVVHEDQWRGHNAVWYGWHDLSAFKLD